MSQHLTPRDLSMRYLSKNLVAEMLVQRHTREAFIVWSLSSQTPDDVSQPPASPTTGIECVLPERDVLPLHTLLQTVDAVASWIAADPAQNVAVFDRPEEHAGSVQGVAVLSYLIFVRHFIDAGTAHSWWVRQQQRALTPSQLRYVGYFAQIVGGVRDKPMLASRLVLETLAVEAKDVLLPKPVGFTIKTINHKEGCKEVFSTLGIESNGMPLALPRVEVEGDVLLKVFSLKIKTNPQLLFQVVFNTQFTLQNRVFWAADVDGPKSKEYCMRLTLRPARHNEQPCPRPWGPTTTP
eukprot:m51a1_g13578 hypothetical protein (295) ;mRNA; r:113-1600